MPYKVLDSNLRSCHGGEAQWVVGQRQSVTGDLVPCKKGIHVCRDERDLLSWIGDVICPCEHSEEYIDHDNKRVVRWACIDEPIPYWNERTARHFSCDCAEYALPHAQDDQRELLQAVIDIARAYADWPEEWAGERNAAGDAAWATRDATWAARTATWAAGATAQDDLAAILATYLDGTNEWIVKEE